VISLRSEYIQYVLLLRCPGPDRECRVFNKHRGRERFRGFVLLSAGNPFWEGYGNLQKGNGNLYNGQLGIKFRPSWPLCKASWRPLVWRARLEGF
jgi:hypothetical protein